MLFSNNDTCFRWLCEPSLKLADITKPRPSFCKTGKPTSFSKQLWEVGFLIYFIFCESIKDWNKINIGFFLTVKMNITHPNDLFLAAG